MSEPRRSSRVKKPVISASKPSAARSSRKQAKGAPIPRASLAGLPVELQFMIFSSVPRPPMRRLVEHGPHQAQIAQLSLICKSTLGAARSALHLAPFFSYRSGAPRTALIKAFGLDEEDGNGNAFGRMMERFTCPNWPNGANNKLHRNTLLEGVLDVASLTTLHLLANDNMNHKSINVHEVITAFLSADQGLDSLVNLRLEGFSTTKLQLVSLCNFLCSSPKLESLHLVLGTLRHATPALHTYPIRPSNYHLRYVHIEFYDLRSGDELSKLVRSLPPSIITLALFVTAWDTVTLGANLLDTLPNLRYLALCYYYLDNLKLPDTILGIFCRCFLERDIQRFMMITLNSQAAFVHLATDSCRASAAADAIIHRNPPALRLITTIASTDSRNQSQALSQKLEYTCQSKGIGYRRYTEHMSFGDWLVDLENRYGQDSDFVPPQVPH